LDNKQVLPTRIYKKKSRWGAEIRNKADKVNFKSSQYRQASSLLPTRYESKQPLWQTLKEHPDQPLKNKYTSFQ